MAAERILLVDGDAPQRAKLASAIRAAGFEVVEVGAPAQAADLLRASPVDGVLCAVAAGGWDCAPDLRQLRARGEEAAIVVGCVREDVDLAVDAMRQGADGYVLLPDTSRVVVALERALERRRLRQEIRELRDQARARLHYVGAQPDASAIEEVVRRVAPTKATVLLQGEAGTGRSFVAELIHEASPRRDRPFVRVPCAGLSETVLDAIVFGSEVALANGEPRHRDGRVDRAEGGTLHLHEVASLSPSMQVKLLRFLQQGEYERVGASQSLRADVRVIASTRLDLAEEVHAGRFRDDLYYRLNVVSLAMKPLRARKGDLPALAAHFLELHGRAQGKNPRALTPGALSALFSYDWPGNVRELERAISHAVAACQGDLVGIEDLPTVLRGARPEEEAGIGLIPGASLFDIEREAILRTLDFTGGSTARAAEILGVSVRKVQYRLKEYRTGQSTARVRAGEA